MRHPPAFSLRKPFFFYFVVYVPSIPLSPYPLDITASLEKIVAESKPHNTAAGTGLSGARHAAASASTAVSGDASTGVSGAVGAAGAVETEEDIREKLNALVDRVKGLRKAAAEATLFLPVYDLRRAQEVRSAEFSSMRRCR